VPVKVSEAVDFEACPLAVANGHASGLNNAATFKVSDTKGAYRVLYPQQMETLMRLPLIFPSLYNKVGVV